jgi:hypothetical protein
MINMYIGLHVRYPLRPILIKPESLDRFYKNLQIWNSVKICPVVAELLHADRPKDGQMDRRIEANKGFPQFCERAYEL